MNDKKIIKSLYNQTPLKILSFLSVQPGIIFSAQEIAHKTDSSKGATNQTLRLFLAFDMVQREKKGTVFLYTLNDNNFVLKQFKIFENVLRLQKMVYEIRPYCYQIVLYGSCADGSNTGESDIDLFVKTEHTAKVGKLINKHVSTSYNIKPVVQDPLEIVSAKKEDKVYFEQVKKGILLWEGKPIDEKI